MGSYGVATQNPFGLLDNENEDPQLLAAAAKVAPAAKPAKKEAVKEEAKAPVAQAAAGRGDAGRGDAGRGRGGRGDVRGRGRGRGAGRGFDRPSADGGEVTENGYDAAPARGEGFRGRGRGEGFRGRGGRGGRGRGEGGADFEGRPRRDYDRRDGTGRGHEAAKRGGAGKGNWGTTGDEANQEENAEAPAEAQPEATDAPAAEPATAEAPAEDTPAEPPVEEVKEMTLDEYEKLLAEKKEALNRKAEAPSVDLAGQFTGMKALSKVDVEEEENPLELLKHKKDPKQIKEKARKEKETLQANFRVGDDPVRRGGGRGGGRGRGGDRPDRPERPASGRGGRGRGDAPPRGGAAASAAPRLRTGPAPAIDDANAFPSLG